jgi:hypothetical protein
VVFFYYYLFHGNYSLIIVDEAAKGGWGGGRGTGRGRGRGGEEVNVWYGHIKKQAGAHMV